MNVRLWITEDQEIRIVTVKSIQQVGRDVCITLDDGSKFYRKQDYYYQVFEDAERQGFIKNVVKMLD